MLRVFLMALGITLASSSSLLRSAPELMGGWSEEPTVVDPTTLVSIRIGARRRNLDRVETVALEVSTPGSPTYGQHWSANQLSELTVPTETSMSTIKAWLQESNVKFEISGTSDQFLLELTVSQASSLFQTSWMTLRNGVTNQKAIRASDVHVPDVVLPHIEALYGVHGLPLPPNSRPGSSRPPRKLYPVTPDVIRTRYNVSGVTPSGTLKNRQAVVEFQGSFGSQKEITEFFKRYVPNAKAGDDQVYKYVGEHRTGEDTESLLDIEYIMGVAPGVKTEFWAYPSMDFCKDVKTWTTALLASDDVPRITSVSYGLQGNLSVIGCDRAEAADIASDFAKVAAKGITIIFASGDSGAGKGGCYEYPQQYTGNCFHNETTSGVDDCCAKCTKTPGCDYWSCDQGMTAKCYFFRGNVTKKSSNDYMSGPPASPLMWPSWPASIPWVTAVGATRFLTNKPGPERATDSFGSGGGFSFWYDQPTWGKAGPAHYFSTEPASKLPPKGTYPPTGRATPDVAALGDGYQVIQFGKPVSVGGTSASAPAFAALISLLNEDRISNGKAPLGFLNPWIHQQGNAMLTDVTVGNNRLDDGPDVQKYGYDCVPGWDPVTGFGTPDFPKMMAAADALP